VVKGAKSFGSIAHWQPAAAIYWIASHISRIPHLRGRPTLLDAGIKGAINAHSSSVQSLA
jgi:hypothetical protein